MPFDALFIQAFTNELDERLRNGRIERVVHPQKDRIILEGRHPYPGIDFFLLFSIHPQYARVHLTEKPKENPKQPSAFCMLLRKHLAGARILSIASTPWERIVTLTLEVYAGGRGLSRRSLILEVLGRRSNLILTDENGLIIDALKREGGERPIAPGEVYRRPAAPTPWNPELTAEELQMLIDRSPSDTPLFKLLYTQLLGISPFVGRETAVRAGYAPESPLSSLPPTAGTDLISALRQIVSELRSPVACLLTGLSGQFEDLSAFYPKQKHIAVERLPDLNEAVNATLHRQDNDAQIKAIQSQLVRLVAEKSSKLAQKLAKQRDELAAAEDAEDFKLFGELLTFYKSEISKGQQQVEVVNYYDSEGSRILIPLRPDLSPGENIQHYYRRYQKAKKGRAAINEQIQITQAELSYFDGLLTILNDPLNMVELQEIKDELQSLGMGRQVRAEKNIVTPSAPHRFVSSEGVPIDVGRNNQQNDRLTFKIASARDTWLHTQGIPGSHVLIRDDGQGYGEATLLEAATLAAWFSKSRSSTKIPVDYTFRRHVRKPPGSHPGFVLYDHVQTLIITPDPEILKRLGVISS